MKKLILLLFVCCTSFCFGQAVYVNGFGATTALPSDPPSTLDAHLSYSSWTISTGSFTSFAGATGQALSMNSASATTTTWTLPLTVTSGYKMALTSFSFWNRASSTGYTNWQLDVNGTVVGSGTVSGTGASTGTINITGSALTAVSNLTGSVNVHLIWSGGTHGGSGTGRLDNFTLNGSTSVTNCSGTPAAGTAAASATDLCTSGTSTITLSGPATGTGISYQWQSSADNATWSNITGASNTGYTTPTITSTTYYRCVTTCSFSSLSANSNSAQVTVTSVTSNPSNASIAVGSGTTFTVGAAGPASYQWQRSTTGTGGTYLNITSATMDVTGTYSGYTTTTSATTNTLTLSGVPVDWNGYAYRCVVTNTCGNINSAGATLTVTVAACSGTPAGGTATPGSSSVCTGGTTILTLSGYSAGSGIGYQWQTSPDGTTWADISGATNLTYGTPSLTSATYYQCVTTCANSGLSATSNTVTITIASTVTPSVTIASSPSPVVVCSSTSVTYTATPTNGGTVPVYQWQKGGTNVSGATNAIYAYAPANGDVITCVLTSTAQCPSPSTATSGNITATVNPSPTPTISGSTAITSGSSANITFTGASGDLINYSDGVSSYSVTLTATTSAVVSETPAVTTTYAITTATSALGCAATISGQSATITVSSGDSTTPTRDNNMGMGNPSGATTSTADSNNYLMVKSQYTLSYNNSKGMANWVSWHLSTAWTGSAPRCDCFSSDAALPSGYYAAGNTSYSGSGFDRGHLCPSADRTGSDSDNAVTFKMTNMSPQAPILNQQTWAGLEDYCRSLIAAGNELYIMAGGYGSGGSGSSGGTTTSIASGHINVPDHFYKIIVVLPVGINDVSRVTTSTRVISVIMPNVQSVNSHPWDFYRVSVDSIESITGYNFLSNVPDSIQAVIEAGVDGGSDFVAAWDFTGASSNTTWAATTYDANLDATSSLKNITRGSTASASSGSNSFRTTGFKNEGISTSNTDYFQTTIKAATGFAVSLTGINGAFNGTSSFYASPGVTSQFAYSLNGSSFTLIGSPVTSTSLTMSNVDLSGISDLQNVPDSVTVYLRYYASGQTTTGGWGFYSSASGVNGLQISGAVFAEGSGKHGANANPNTTATQNNLLVTMKPNPATTEVNINFTSPRTDNVSIRIFDLSGTTVYTRNMGMLQNGNINVSLKDLAPGTYIAELVSGNQKAIQRLVKQ